MLVAHVVLQREPVVSLAGPVAAVTFLKQVGKTSFMSIILKKQKKRSFFDKNNTIFKIFTLGISLKVKKRTQNERVEDHHCKK